MVLDKSSIYTTCKILKRYIEEDNPDIIIKESVLDYFNACVLDIGNKTISEQSKKHGLGEFEHFMSVTYHQKHEELTTEVPLITPTDKNLGDDAFVVPSTCHIQAVHSHAGKIPVIHMHMFCSKGYDLKQVANFISLLTNINKKNIDI